MLHDHVITKSMPLITRRNCIVVPAYIYNGLPVEWDNLTLPLRRFKLIYLRIPSDPPSRASQSQSLSSITERHITPAPHPPASIHLQHNPNPLLQEHMLRACRVSILAHFLARSLARSSSFIHTHLHPSILPCPSHHLRLLHLIVPQETSVAPPVSMASISAMSNLVLLNLAGNSFRSKY